MVAEKRPKVSIVTATYNRSNVLALAVRTVRWQTFSDWELIVVGDQCTDDTEEVMRGFSDPRVRFVNLERNCGEQSGPNNEGVRLARGRFIAYLNHDDLWLPDHLETAVSALEHSGADLVFTLVAAIGGDGRGFLAGAAPSGRYDPAIVCPASSWLLRGELAAEIGPWRYYRQIHDIPSSDWLHRAWKAGKDMRLAPRLTVIAVQSARRDLAYARRESAEQESYFARMRAEPDFRERELTALAVAHAARDPLFRQNLFVLPYLLRAGRNLVWKIGSRLGLTPNALRQRLLHLRRGGSIDRSRKRRGLAFHPRESRQP